MSLLRVRIAAGAVVQKVSPNQVWAFHFVNDSSVGDSRNVQFKNNVAPDNATRVGTQQQRVRDKCQRARSVCRRECVGETRAACAATHVLWLARDRAR